MLNAKATIKTCSQGYRDNTKVKKKGRKEDIQVSKFKKPSVLDLEGQSIALHL